ncbi:hypothetical protein OTK55_07365 [Methanosphaera sp. Vir-13MRS]|uniref:hypothetical protein n=1 Tax=Candidatus Methanosphaera massiliense TaxID=3017187 RepID=UPI0023806577|nr:hypothetical protein [Candidatus Methanosphaera massiliense]MDE4078834.1 hypothetical protein [Candidatus Methanosphaera massiliense]MDY2745534.1 hypothetical protein [Methanosphaera sp.]
MKGDKIIGILIIIALIISVCLVGYSLYNGIQEEQSNITYQQLTEDQLSQILQNNTNNSSIQRVVLNINSPTGGANINFTDSNNIYNISSDNNKGKVTYAVNGDTLEVNVTGNETGNNIVLSNKYNYDINVNYVAGGYAINVSNGARVNSLNSNMTAGGANIDLNGGSLNNLNFETSVGGVNIEGIPNGQTNIATTIDIGGVNIGLNQPVGHIISKINLGGTNSNNNYQNVSATEFKGNNFDSSSNRLELNSNIQMGGVNIN